MKLKSFALTSLGVLGGAMIASAGDPAPAPAPAPAPPTPSSGGLFDEIGAELSLGYDTHYMFRGVNFGEHLIWSDLNVTLPLAEAVELNVGAWYASLAQDDYTELNLYAGLSYSVTDSFSVGLGYTWYYFPRTEDDINEIGASLSYAVTDSLGLEFGYYYDFETEGSYFELGSSYEIALTDAISLVPGAAVAFGDDYYGVSGGSHVGLTLALPIQLTESASLTPYVGGNIPIDSLDDLGEDDRVYGGVALTVSF